MQRGDRDLRSAPAEGTRRGAFRIAFLYAVIGALWILFSDRVLEIVVGDTVLRSGAQTVKGGLYVLVTAVLL
ncbi:MAG: PAS domain-containing sensor histidine kinase, partial [Anaeromyxobacteraceae bacterium]